MGFFNGKDEPESGFTVEELRQDAERKLAILRAMAAEFIDERDPQPLTTVEQREATRVHSEYLEAAEDVVRVAPDLPGMPEDASETLRFGRAVELYYMPVADLAEQLAEQIHTALVRKKSFGAWVARFIDRLARALVTSGVAEWLRPYVDELKSILRRPPHAKAPFPISDKNSSREVTSDHES